ncbi:MAG: hypothetical protein LBR07_06720 [Puniceicoccales bacterium]|nr:hypothetical protein [Puniceicoccales bacterium]
MFCFSKRALCAAAALLPVAFASRAAADETVTGDEKTAAGASTAPAAPTTLAPVVVTAARVANPEPAEGFSTPVTLLRFDPLVDVQARGLGEAATDISLRGGTYLNTGFSLGGLSLTDPQTGHYLGEIPVAPAMLGAPKIVTGAAAAQSGWNATAGNVAYEWQPVVAGGTVSLAAGGHREFGADAVAGAVAGEKFLGRTVGVDVAAAFGTGDGPFGEGRRVSTTGAVGERAKFSEHEFSRYNVRLQLRDAVSQTDVFAGYQTKDFLWPNLYAKRAPGPKWQEEREQLETQLYAVSHRQEFGTRGDFVRAGAYYRINTDIYSLPWYVLASGAVYAARHRTNVAGAGVDGRQTLAGGATEFANRTGLRYRAGIVADDLASTDLRYGRYMSRTQFYAGAYADQTLALGAGAGALDLTAGVTLDESNRLAGAWSPTAGIAWRNGGTGTGGTGAKKDAPVLRRVALEYAASSQTPDYTALNNSPTGLFAGNRDLGRSRAHNVELAAELGTNVAGGGALALKPAVFWRRDDNLVDWVFDPANPNASRSVCAVDLDTTGVELVAQCSWRRVDLVLGYAWLHRHDDYTNAAAGSYYAGNYAEHRVTAALVARVGWGVEIRCDNELRFQAENPLREGTSHPFLTSLAVSWRVPLFDAKTTAASLTIAAVVDNLWNVNYQEIPLVPGQPRVWSLRATWRF